MTCCWVGLQLERLKTKSLLERVGERRGGFDQVATRIGVHDLWGAFCVAETKSGELRQRRWVYDGVPWELRFRHRLYEEVNSSELLEASPSGTGWENVKRMAFVDAKFRGLEKVKFTHFSNVTVLKISGFRMS